MARKSASKAKSRPVRPAVPAGLPLAMLDALTAITALLDHRGVIVAVNRAWRRYAPGGAANWVGQDYLAVCARAKGAFSAEASAAATGIRRVLAGRAREFTLDYPCHAPTRAQWFRLVVAPVRLDGGTGALVMHVDVTELKETGEQRLRLAHNLGERVKELRALHGAARLLQVGDADVARLLACFVALVPPAMQYPGITAARVSFGRVVRSTPGFRTTPWRLEETFVTTGGVAGRLQVVYRRKRPALAEGPFFAEERQLVRSLAEMLRTHFERQEAEAGLRATQIRQQLILDGMEEGVHGLDRDGRITFENRAAAAMFGYPPVELIGRPAHALIHHHRADGSVYPVADCPIHRTLRDGRVRHVEGEVFFRKDGRSFPVDYVCSPVRDGAGAVVGAVVCFRDVTERRRTAETLQTSQTIQRIAGRVARLGGWSLELATGELTWTDEMCALHEVPPGHRPTVEEAINYYRPEYRARIAAQVEACTARGTPIDFEFELTTARGRHRWMRAFGEAVRDPAGKIVRLQGALQDITERKQAEREQQRLNDQLALEKVRLVAAQAVAKVGSWVTDLATMAVDWSEETHRIFGTDPAVFQPTHAAFLERVHPDDRAAVDAALRDSIGRREPQAVEHRIVLGDGSVKQVEERWQVEYDSAGRPMRAIGTCQDITERKLAEAEVHRLAQRLTTTLESITDAFFTVDRDWRFTYLNRRAEQLLQRTQADLIGSELWQEFPAAVGTIFDREYRRALVERVSVSFEAYYPPPLDGWFEVNAYPSEEGLAVYFRDITAARRMREELRQSEQRFREMAENIGDIFYNYDPVNDRLLYTSPAAERIMGRPLAEQYARPTAYIEWVHPDDRAEAEGAFRRQLAGEETVVDFRVIRPDGSECWVREHAVPVRGADGRIERLVGTMRDITEHRRATEEIRRHNETLAGIVESLQEIAATDRPTPDLMRVMAERAQALTRAEGAVVEMIEGAELVYTAGSGLAAVSLGLRVPVQGSLTGLATVVGEALLSEDTETDPRVDREASRRAGVRSMVVAPLRDGPKVIGVLKVMASRPRAFTATDVSNLQILVESLGAVLQRQLATERVRRSEERFRLLTRATNDAVWDWDLTTDAVWWNEGYETLFGRRRAEIPGDSRSWSDYIHPEDRPRVVDGIHAVIDGGGTEWNDEYRFQHLDGRYIHVADRGEVVRAASGRALRMIGGMTDLTERKLIEDKLREQAALLDTATDAILVRDLDQRIVYWNRSAERLYGWTSAEALGRTARELLYETTEPFERATAALLAKGEWIGELAQRTKDGRALTVECRWTLVRDAQGRPKSILAINTDITERRRLEQQFLRGQRMESIGTLAGGIAHDLNNLLAPILMGAELLQRQQLTDSGRETLRNIERSARRSTELVRQVLSFARGIAGERIPLQVRHLVREIEDIIASTFPRNIDLDVSLPKDLWLVPGDATQLNQVLLNLCVNARDAMPEGGRLVISAENRALDAQYAATDGTVPAGDYVLVEVTDSGSGMTREVQERIFDPFFTTKELGKGTGLGLSTVLGIVRSHGGAVTVQSEPGRGSTFRVWLPAEPAATVDEPVAPRPPAIHHGQGQLILLVDDEPGVLDITQQTLEAFGYRVLTARDGAQAVGLYALQQQEIAAVLTDLMMPVMDGPALIAALQRIHPGVRLVAATGVNTGDYMARALALGVKHFLTKPFTAEALLEMMHEVLAAPPGGGSRPPMELPAR